MRPFSFAILFCCCAAFAKPDVDWPVVGGTPGYTRYSPLAQIHRGNVSRLETAWSFHAGNNSDELKTSLECNPIVVGGRMFITSPVMEVIALNPVTGAELWRYNPFPSEQRYSATGGWAPVILATLAALEIVLAMILFRQWRERRRTVILAGMYLPSAVFLLWGTSIVLPRTLPDVMKEERRGGANRGLTFWASGPEARLLFAGGHRLVALDPATGALIDSFGDHGVVDLRRGLGRDITGLLYSVTSPGALYRNLCILSARVGEGPKEAAPGHIRAFDVITGEQKWIFHTIPHPGEFGYDTWPRDAWKKAGGANAWAGMTVDDQRGIVYAPIGSAAFDFYGGDRHGDNLFSNTLVALRADTGERVWHYQMIHHDLWDYDLASPPNLVTVTRNGLKRDVVVAVLKTGMTFVLDRDNGEPVFPVEERPVPASEMPGESASKTQPVPALPPSLTRQSITEEDLTNLSPAAHQQAVKRFRQLASAKMFVPPGTAERLIVPGYSGGGNWSGASVDPRRGWLVTNTNEWPNIFHLIARKPWQSFPYGFAGFERFSDSEGYPAIKPPWGKLSQIDLNTGEIRWQVPLGEFPELARRGIPPTGVPNAGGSIMTAGGLIFIGATADHMFRAFDADTGAMLWQTPLRAAAHAMPATYQIDGRQYVAIAAGGGSMIGSATGDEIVAFRLPE